MGQQTTAIVLGCQMTPELIDAITIPDADPDFYDGPLEELDEFCCHDIGKLDIDRDYGSNVIGFALGTCCEDTLPHVCRLADLPDKLKEETALARGHYKKLRAHVRETYGVELPEPELFIMEVERA